MEEKPSLCPFLCPYQPSHPSQNNQLSRKAMHSKSRTSFTKVQIQTNQVAKILVHPMLDTSYLNTYYILFLLFNERCYNKGPPLKLHSVTSTPYLDLNRVLFPRVFMYTRVRVRASRRFLQFHRLLNFRGTF